MTAGVRALASPRPAVLMVPGLAVWSLHALSGRSCRLCWFLD